jgi:DNA-binding NarL/FixJ family response regulator
MTMDKGDSFKYSILLVDDHPPVRHAIKKIIEASPEFKVIGELDDAWALLKFLEKSPARLVVLDISMPRMNGFEATWRIKQAHPDTKVLILTIQLQGVSGAGPVRRGRRLPLERRNWR